MKRANTLTIALSICFGFILLMLAIITAKKLTNWTICLGRQKRERGNKKEEEEHEIIELSTYGGERDDEEEEKEEANERDESAQIELLNGKIARLSEELELTKDRLQILEKKLNKLGC